MERLTRVMGTIYGKERQTLSCVRLSGVMIMRDFFFLNWLTFECHNDNGIKIL